MALPYRRLLPALACPLLRRRAPRESTGTGESTLIVGTGVLGGTGAPARVAAVRAGAGRIAAVGAPEPRAGERAVAARGPLLAPGIIDAPVHHDGMLRVDPGAIGGAWVRGVLVWSEARATDARPEPVSRRATAP